jgi:uncharacterized repeat protein (TIGR02543 family)
LNSSGQLGDGTTIIRYTPIRLYTNSIYSNESINYLFIETLIEKIPTREGYTFEGWFIDSALTISYAFTTMPAEDLTLYGKWEIFSYDINYELNGGTNADNPITYTIESSTIILNEPTREGYTFLGWYENNDFDGDPITEIKLGSTGDVKLYAKWQIN